MIVGSVPIFDGPVSRYVSRTGVAMLSLQYRLAPEHPHPVPVEDAYSGLVWLAARAGKAATSNRRPRRDGSRTRPASRPRTSR
jgi:acetyl esterase/lipase